MRTKPAHPMPVLLALLISGCASSIGRIVITDGKQDQSHIAIGQTKPVEFWADVDVSYLDTAEILYHIKVFQNDSMIFACGDDALFHHDAGGTYMFMMNSRSGNRQRVRYQKKLDCSFTPTGTGDYRIEVEQVFHGRLFEVNKCDLILKQ